MAKGRPVSSFAQQAGVNFILLEKSASAETSMWWPPVEFQDSSHTLMHIHFSNGAYLQHRLRLAGAHALLCRLQHLEGSHNAINSELDQIKSLGSSIEGWKHQMNDAGAQAAAVLALVQSDGSELRCLTLSRAAKEAFGFLFECQVLEVTLLAMSKLSGLHAETGTAVYTLVTLSDMLSTARLQQAWILCQPLGCNPWLSQALSACVIMQYMHAK